MSRRQHTYQIINRQQDDKLYADSLSRLRLILQNGGLPRLNDKTRQDDHEKIDYLLNHFEFLSAAIWAGDIDERLMRDCHRSILLRLNEQLSEYIEENRDAADQPSMWIHLQKLAERWDGDDPRWFERLYEAVMLRPCRECPKWLRLIDRVLFPR